VTQLLIAVLATGVWGSLLQPYLSFATAKASPAPAPKSTTFDTITVQRINVTDVDGKTRLIIANSARFPGGIIRGKEYPRSINDSAGLLFLDTKGNETGGLATTKLRDKEVANLSLDYGYQLTDGIKMWKWESQDGAHWRAGFDILDRRPYTGAIESSQGVQRITLADEDQNAQLVISDALGHPRIRIGVDKNGQPRMEMLNPEGKVVYSAESNAR
jgi:hypothetical protein